ncbi:MAG: hypothetical protein HKN10_13160 [Myxococcales bacterium]|nr:hypothetical protein [Myxococcales bacterium]
MRWFLACALLVVAGCGEPEEGQGLTLVTIAGPPETFPNPEMRCANDPPPSGEEWNGFLYSEDGSRYSEDGFRSHQHWCTEVLDTGECVLFLNPPRGPCTLRVTHRSYRDENFGETLCFQEEDFVVSGVGDTEVDITLDDCEPDMMPL